MVSISITLIQKERKITFSEDDVHSKLREGHLLVRLVAHIRQNAIDATADGVQRRRRDRRRLRRLRRDDLFVVKVCRVVLRNLFDFFFDLRK